jgi:hypothetical protein
VGATFGTLTIIATEVGTKARVGNGGKTTWWE